MRPSDLNVLQRLVKLARPCWPHLAGILGLNFLSPPLALLTPLPLKIAVDSVIGSEPIPDILQPFVPAMAAESATALLIYTAILVVIIGGLTYLQGLALWLLDTYTGQRLVLDFRAHLFRHVQRLSLSYHDTRGTTDSLYRIQYDAPAVQWILINGVAPFVTSFLTLAGMLYITAQIQWHLALVAALVTPILFVLTRASSRRLRNRWDQVKQDESNAMSVVQEVLSSVRVVKAFGQEDREHDRFLHHARRGMLGQVRLAFVAGGFDLLVGLTIAAGTGAVLFIGVQQVLAGTLTLGNLLLVMTYLVQLYGPLQTISKKIAELQASLSSAARAFSLLDEMTDVPEHPDARPIERAHGRIVLDRVTFSYAGTGAVLKDVSCRFDTGSTTGIIGATGAGKTTIVNLLMRFYDPTAGTISLDGVNLREYRVADLRNQISVVLQDPVLFSSTIGENIAYALPGASEAAIVEAAKAANAHDFIARLPDGYNTRVGERGMTLSGGERQRISMARAFLKNAPLLILDEPTSAVDAGTEHLIIQAMERLLEGRTTIIITHRMNLLQHCDNVFRIEQGKIEDVSTTKTQLHDPK